MPRPLAFQGAARRTEQTPESLTPCSLAPQIGGAARRAGAARRSSGLGPERSNAAGGGAGRGGPESPGASEFVNHSRAFR